MSKQRNKEQPDDGLVTSMSTGDDPKEQLNAIEEKSLITPRENEVIAIKRMLDEREHVLHIAAEELQEKERQLKKLEETLEHRAAEVERADAKVSEKLAIIKQQSGDERDTPLIRAYRLTGPHDGYRRAGLTLTRSPSIVPVAGLSVEQIKQLRNDKRVRLEEVIV